jgi:hypothetical protein
MYGPDTVFLQQAAHLTGGSYILLERRDALLQYLIVRYPHSILIPSCHINSSYCRCPFCRPLPLEKSLLSQHKIELISARRVSVTNISLTLALSVQCVSPVCLDYFHLVSLVHITQSSVNLFQYVRRAGKPIYRDLSFDALCTNNFTSTKFPIKALQRLQSSRPSITPQTRATSTSTSMGLPSTSQIGIINGAVSTSTNGGLGHGAVP